eukprot:CAMPEP_0183368688 /NCGR_PEP_ID=MMETSP0164_2-20130417/96815_1 /TAXON_ID=221442 /ORGANISM="Coccolithus pelagicus ssp braarudi, Strain PLY182g" /LENGTH=51 /DNA_ID=CAMNT_0025544825 /DNA_START=75 /DNA_END=227 /DNA_ORIENTATION=+
MRVADDAPIQPCDRRDALKLALAARMRYAETCARGGALVRLLPAGWAPADA